MPLAIDAVNALRSGQADGTQFEDVLFHYLVRHKKVIFRTTNLAGVQQAPLHIESKIYNTLTNPPSKVNENTLLRCYQGYPRFDYIYNRTFIQTSISSFSDHNVKGASISRAFLHPEPPEPGSAENNGETSGSASSRGKRKSKSSDESTLPIPNDGASISASSRGKSKSSDESTLTIPNDGASSSASCHGKRKRENIDESQDTFDRRNQIEVYLDSVYGGSHKANIDPVSKHFKVSKDGEE
ncbi:hypothetical protein BGZ80_007919, partial [Entomortierella chlamydospora]